jgi:hypothetical protein
VAGDGGTVSMVVLVDRTPAAQNLGKRSEVIRRGRRVRGI